jgi:hypothetical protein
MIDDVALNDKIVNTVKNAIPRNIKTTDCLMEILGLSRESVYRRIRKEIPFSIGELIKLSLTLGFSIDEIVEGNKSTHFVPDLQSPTVQFNGFISLFHEYNNYFNILATAKETETFLALNEMLPLFTVFNENLFKFSYYRDICTNSKKICNTSLSELKIPRELRSLYEKLVTNIHFVKDVVLIFSPNIYLSLIKRILYFYQRKLLTVDEFLMLKEEVLNLIDVGDKITKYGFGADANIDIYLSSLHINSNTLYINYDETVETHFWIYDSNPLIIKNKDICVMQKEWFQSLKKRASLITQSNEILQDNFFNEQRKHVKTYLDAEAVFPYNYIATYIK